MRYLAFIFVVLFLASCKKHNFEIDNLNGNRIDALGHAGMGLSSLYPINSAESVLNAISIGANGTELDIQLSKDNILVAFHDENLNNSTNLEGFIRDYTWEEIKNASYNSTQYLSYKITRVSELMENVVNRSNYLFSFDVKLYPGTGEQATSYYNDFVNAVALLFNNYNLYSHCFIEAQSETFINELATINGQIKTFIYPQDFNSGFELAINNGLYGISIHNDNITKEQVKIAHENGLYIIIWGVNKSSKNEEAILKNPDIIETDALKNLIKTLGNSV